MSQKFTFFWHSNSPFSNWYISPFVHHGITYNCSEQYMMYQKAILFKDFEVAEMILEQTLPKKQKFLGRMVRDYDDSIWMKECLHTMNLGLKSKFTQNEFCLKSLLDTGDTIIAEASPYDKIWGNGMTITETLKTPIELWKGTNRLGLAIMKVRNTLRTM